jgi:hypothetical protein
MSVQDLFDEVSLRLLGQDTGVERARMFNSVGLKTAGKFFATMSGEELLLKLPAPRVQELVAGGTGRPFHSGGRLMKEWVCVRPADEATCAAYVDEARAFVAAQARSGTGR